MTTPEPNPYPLGKLTTTAGTKVPLTSDADLWAKWLEITALNTNTTDVYLGKSTMNTTTLVGVQKILSPGMSWVIDGGPGNTIRVADYSLDVVTTGEGIYSTCKVL